MPPKLRDNKGRYIGESTYTPEIEQFIINNYKGNQIDDTLSKVNKKFGTNFSKESLKTRAYKLGLTSGVNPGGFKEGISNKKASFPIGTITYSNFSSGKTGTKYLYIKVKDEVRKNGHAKDNWMLYKNYVWEQHNGKIPERHFIWCADGDETNCDISNLRLIPWRYVQALTRQNKWVGKGAAMLDAGIAWCDLHYALIDKEKNNG